MRHGVLTQRDARVAFAYFAERVGLDDYPEPGPLKPRQAINRRSRTGFTRAYAEQTRELYGAVKGRRSPRIPLKELEPLLDFPVRNTQDRQRKLARIESLWIEDDRRYLFLALWQRGDSLQEIAWRYGREKARLAVEGGMPNWFWRDPPEVQQIHREIERAAEEVGLVRREDRRGRHPSTE
ncbi:MAG: hypothetical protein ACREK5_10585 [Gemmatimonadota bacterium]